MTHPLYQVYPRLAHYIAPIPLANLPTPVLKMNGFDSCWMKCDDGTHSEYGGNRIRKLEFVLADIRNRHARGYIPSVVLVLMPD